ncbi:MAG TPA: inositol monophosphatase family protein [Candidatus Thermoplasmatota archaeon]|jgi:fructose-1,6-bisphosphatase/inositol monophosphatase family enzyme|nr:inositol monophosphatase family protein [Candidatus Thermoplasmatota archaeon]
MPAGPAIEAKDLERYIAALRACAEAVNKAVLAAPLEGRGNVLGMGADGTDTKAIDKLAEDVAFRSLQEHGVKPTIVSEEAGALRGEEPWTLVMDPLDGTTNAINNLPIYCISLALGQGTTDGLVYGLVRNLPTGDVYEAIKGQGATLNGKPLKVRKLVAKEKPTVSVVLGKKADDFALTLAGTWGNIRSFGCAALETSLVGAGAMDAYYHGYGSLRVTDIAAGVLIVREAGGECYDGTLKRLVMDLSLEKRTTMLAVGDRTFAERAGAIRR